MTMQKSGAGVNPVAPGRDCDLCPRLVTYRETSRAANEDWYNAPVQSFGPLDAKLLIVGLAPGMKGANRTGRPFTGDYAGDLLYPTLAKVGLSEGEYGASPEDGLRLTGCRITNAVRCVPPENKPTGAEAKACRPFLVAEIEAMTNLRVILALGVVAHNAVLATLGERLAAYKFKHGSVHDLGRTFWFADSYHCSRYNTNTGRLTEAMFHSVFERLQGLLKK